MEDDSGRECEMPPRSSVNPTTHSQPPPIPEEKDEWAGMGWGRGNRKGKVLDRIQKRCLPTISVWKKVKNDVSALSVNTGSSRFVKQVVYVVSRVPGK